jgi:phosphoribosylaminoimidazole carboxylase PurE protein
MEQPKVAILLGSDSDLAVMRAAAEVLAEFGVPHEVHVLSAHRSPERALAYVRSARDRGVRVVIAGAGMAAHLAGTAAAATTLPVVGVPLASAAGLCGLDALLATVQMPPGVPVATVAIGGARNAAYLALRILALGDGELAERLEAHRRRMDEDLAAKDGRLQQLGIEGYSKSTGEAP